MALVETYYGPNGPDDKTELFTAESFLNFIRRSNPVWHKDEENKEEQQWVYRGHWNSNWRLVPSAAREFDEGNPLTDLIQKISTDLPRDLKMFGIKLTENQKKCYSFVSAATHVYNHFTAEASTLGYIDINRRSLAGLVENDAGMSTFIPNTFGSSDFETTGGRATKSLYNIHHMGTYHYHLAQHHQIPTFLLDWSNTPLTAAHFATNSPDIMRDEHDICVWAINKQALTKNTNGIGAEINDLDENSSFGMFDEILRIDAAKQDNDYLAAQDGLFTFVRIDFGIWSSTGKYPCLTQILEKWVSIRNRHVDNRAVNDQSILRKIVLPSTELPMLRKLLRLEGISRARLMPSLDNVAKDALDRARDELTPTTPKPQRPYRRRRVSLASHSRSKSLRRMSF